MLTLPAHTPSLPVRTDSSTPSSSKARVKVTTDASGCGTAQQGVNTSDGERHGDGGSEEGEGVGEGRGWCEEEKGVAGGKDATAVSSGLWNQELCALLRPCTTTTTTPTPPPRGPPLCSGQAITPSLTHHYPSFFYKNANL